MALMLGRVSQLIRHQGGQNLPQLLKQSSENALGSCTTVAANLTSYHGEEAPRYRPWPYEQKGFRPWHVPQDRVDWRLDDNSKIIVIDGNLATGKTALGKHIAKQFDLLYVPDVTDTEMYWWETGHKYDPREHDEQLPFAARSCDFETFYSQGGYKKVLKNFPRTQYFLFRYKMMRYAQRVLAHVLNTGQGVVMNRGMWSDFVWANALNKGGWMSNAALKRYKIQYQDILSQWWHPHLVIYIDAPVDLVQEKIKKRNTPWEQDSPVITSEFLQTIRDTYKGTLLPYMRQYSEVLEYDLSEGDLDYDMINEDLEHLDLENLSDTYPYRFKDWDERFNRDYNQLRKRISPNNQLSLEKIFELHVPFFKAPELWLEGHDYFQYEKIVLNDPRCHEIKLMPSMPTPCSVPLSKPR